MAVRFFVSQEALDVLVEAGTASLDSEALEVSARKLRARVEQAVYITTEVEGKGDPNNLVGKVKTIAALEGMKGEHYRDSLLVGETAYEVIEGYVGFAEEGWKWPDGGARASRSSVPVPPESSKTVPMEEPQGLPEPAGKRPQDAAEVAVRDAMEMMILDTVKDAKKKPKGGPKSGGRAR